MPVRVRSNKTGADAVLSIFLVWGLWGCQAPPIRDTGLTEMGSDDATIAIDCELVSEQSVSFSEDLGGFTANSAVNLVQGTHNKTLTWRDSNTTGITLTLWGALNAVFRDMEGGQGGECTDHLLIPMSLRIVTNDGQINFEAPVDIRAYSAATTGFTQSLDRTDILFRPESWVTGSFDRLTAELGAEWVGTTLVGQITAFGETDDPDGTKEAFVIGQF